MDFLNFSQLAMQPIVCAPQFEELIETRGGRVARLRLGCTRITEYVIEVNRYFNCLDMHQDISYVKLSSISIRFINVASFSF